MTSGHNGELSEGLWVGAMWADGEREILPLMRHYADASFDLLDDARYTVPVRAALRAIIDEHARCPTPRMYRITPAHLERHPVLIGAILAGRWQRHARTTPDR
jgi:hypothetical protein